MVRDAYDEQRYMYRGKLAESRLEKNCLEEYAEVFKTVCVDAGYYRFPGRILVKGFWNASNERFKVLIAGKSDCQLAGLR